MSARFLSDRLEKICNKPPYLRVRKGRTLDPPVCGLPSRNGRCVAIENDNSGRFIELSRRRTLPRRSLAAPDRNAPSARLRSPPLLPRSLRAFRPDNPPLLAELAEPVPDDIRARHAVPIMRHRESAQRLVKSSIFLWRQQRPGQNLPQSSHATLKPIGNSASNGERLNRPGGLAYPSRRPLLPRGNHERSNQNIQGWGVSLVG